MISPCAFVILLFPSKIPQTCYFTNRRLLFSDGLEDISKSLKWTPKELEVDSKRAWRGLGEVERKSVSHHLRFKKVITDVRNLSPLSSFRIRERSYVLTLETRLWPFELIRKIFPQHVVKLSYRTRQRTETKMHLRSKNVHYIDAKI